ncbi:hypothetical protein PQR08_32200 [Caballeronia jiangsuensis]|uniref:Lipoprotein n=1 Tax=Caballeronia jiangsuensis TaxID=1458357 RepID=A0ABW9CWS5_9BURK
MTKREKRVAVCAAVASAMLFASIGVHAQESANDDLDSCVKHEQIVGTAKGAGLGALAGLGAMLVAHKKEDAGKAALIGAVAGGVAGWATSFYTANETCYKKNPAWIPESKLNRTKDYDKIKKEIHYNAKQGPLAKMQSIQVPGPVTPNSQAEVTSTFIVMTPNGADAPVTIDRKLFVIEDGKEKEVAFPGHSSQQLTLEPGQQQDVSHIPIPPDAKPGSTYRVQMAVTTDGSPTAVASQQFTVTQ